MRRRNLLLALAAAPAMGTWTRLVGAGQKSGNQVTLDEIRNGWESLLADGADVVLSTEPLDRSEQQWRKILSPQAFDVLRNEGTERPYASPLNNEVRPGVFVCVGCKLPVFTSAMKYDSGTGWPSFFTTIPGAFETKRDWKLLLPRTEYHCNRCGGHHGHVFDDGPPPTGERWCNNGAALEFIPKG